MAAEFVLANAIDGLYAHEYAALHLPEPIRTDIVLPPGPISKALSGPIRTASLALVYRNACPTHPFSAKASTRASV